MSAGDRSPDPPLESPSQQPLQREDNPPSSSSFAPAPDSPAASSDGTSPDHAVQEERQERSYSDIYEQIKDKRLRVAAIERVTETSGAAVRTKSYIIDRELERIQQASTLQELHLAMEEAGRNLQQLNIFSRVDLLANEEPEDDPEACTVLLDIKEKNWYKVHAATYIQEGESTMEGGVSLCNVRGRAEQIGLSAECGTNSSSQFALTFEQPRVAGSQWMFDARLHQYLRNYQKVSSFTEKTRGGTLGFKSMDGVHGLQLDLGWRQLTDSTLSASKAVLAQIGDYLKASARYTLFIDRRQQDGQAPTSGWAFRSTTEVAGLPGQDQGEGGAANQWAKQQLDFQYLLPLIKRATLSLNASGGVMLPWGSDQPLSRPTCIADRFFLGGPSTLRGWEFKGAGPSDQCRPNTSQGTASASTASAPPAAASSRRDALGGDLFMSLLAAVTFPLPLKALDALRIHGHVFVNGGSCTQLSGTGLPLSQSADKFLASTRWSAGAGLVLPTWFGRFEANYVHVLAQQEHDRVVKSGVQLGFASSAFM